MVKPLRAFSCAHHFTHARNWSIQPGGWPRRTPRSLTQSASLLFPVGGVHYCGAFFRLCRLRLRRFRTGKQSAGHCGLMPCNRSSGAREADAGLIRAANPELRRALIEAA
jgi:hypothetical protein